MRFFHSRNKPRQIYYDAKPNIRHSIASLACTAVNGIIGVILLFELRLAVLSVVVISGVNPWAVNFIEIAATIGLCLALIVFIFVAQHLYEKDFMGSWVPKRFLIYTCVQLALLAAVYAFVK